MKKVLFASVTLIFIWSCNNTRNDNKDTQNDSPSAKSDTSKIISKNEDKNKHNNIPDFLNIIKNKKSSTLGFLQGVVKNDSSGPYVVKEFYSDTLDFDLIFFPKDLNKSAVDLKAINKAAINNFDDYICFSFVYPMKDPNKMADYHSDNTPYPITVKSYVKKGGEWEFFSMQKVKNLTELSQYEISTMYKNLPK